MANNMMTAASTTTVEPKNLVQKYFAKRLLVKARQESLWMNLVSEMETIPKMIGNTVRFYYFENPTEARNLTEGLPGDGKYLSTGYVESTLVQKGDYYKLSDIVENVSLFSLVAQAVDSLGYMGSLTVDGVIQRAAIYGGYREGEVSFSAITSDYTLSTYIYNHTYTSNKTFPYIAFSGAMPITPVNNIVFFSAFSQADALLTNNNMGFDVQKFKAAILQLKVANIKPFSDGYYRAIIHPNIAHYLTMDPEFREWHHYINPAKTLMQGEIGEIAKCRLIESVNTPVWGSLFSATIQCCSAYVVTIVGDGALATIDHASDQPGSGAMQGLKKVKIFVHKPGPQSTENPLEQYMTVGMKLYMTAKVLMTEKGRNLLAFYCSSEDRK